MSTPWQLVPLGGVLRRANRFERKDDLAEYQFAGTYSYARGIFVGERKEGVNFGLDKIQRVKTGDFVYCKIMAWEGAFGIVPDEADNCVMSGAFVSYEVNRERIDPKYLDYYFKIESVWKSIGGQSTGTNVRRRSLHPDQFEKAIIPLPPLPEQRRIVARIEDLAAKIEEARGLREKAIGEAKALLPSGRSKFFSDHTSRTKPRRLEELTSRITKGESPEWQGFTYQEQGPTFVRSENVLWGKLDLSTRTHVPKEFHRKLSRSQLQPRDVLINLVGASIGRTCVVPSDIGDANINQAVAVLTPVQEELESEYLMNFVLASTTQDVIHGGKVETARPNISLGDLRDLEIPAPSLTEQRRIVAYLDDLQSKVDALKKLQEETAKELDAMLPSVLDKAFRGEL